MFELYKSPHYGLGTCVEVKINKKTGYISRQYTSNAITVSGNTTTKSPQEIKDFFDNEVYWLTKLRDSKWLPKLIWIDKHNQTIYQEYNGPCLLDIKSSIKVEIPNIVEQIIEMYEFFKEQNMFKCNGSLSNLTIKGTQVKAFDFKWATHRPNNIEMEIKSYEQWLSKIDNSLTDRLKELL